MNISLAIFIALLLLFASTISSNASRPAVKKQHHHNHHSFSQATTRTNPKPMSYHGGPILANSNTLNVYIIWYGNFSSRDKSIITDFFASFHPKNRGQKGQPTVSKWWQTITSYKDKDGKSIPGKVVLVKQLKDSYSSGKKDVKRAQIADLVQDKVDKKIFPRDHNGVYFVFTSKDVTVERFCLSSCGFHGTTFKAKGSDKVVIAHVGDASLQCPGFCAWPYAVPPYGPPFNPLPSPNGVGADGVVMNIATVLAGSATNPFNNGYYQGDVRAPLEAVSACSGKFGDGAFPGFPGKLLNDPAGNATYNVFGANGRRFLLPAMWDLQKSSCKVVF